MTTHPPATSYWPPSHPDATVPDDVAPTPPVARWAPPTEDAGPPPEVSRWAALAERDGRDPRWARPVLAVLLVGTALLYLVDLSASGYANTFYAAAVQAGTKSWKAFFFGSLDSSNAITVDKPPLSLWPMEIAGRIFGFSSWSMLVPQAVMGVAAVWLLHATVKRWFGPVAGLVAGLVLAITPVAVLMFRFNNPDALMTLLLVAGAFCLTRALEGGRLRWVLLVGVTFGLGFLTKGLQPFTVLPAFALAYLLLAPTGIGRRIVHLVLGGLAIVASAGWWVLTVLLWPVADRPYIGGSTDNNPLELAFGYNGLGRLTGNEAGGAGAGAGGTGGDTATRAFGGGGGGSFSGSTGVGRLFGAEMGGQIAWLLPAALIATVALLGAALAARRAGTDSRRLLGATIIFGGWLVVTGAVLSFASGTIHPYYTVQLAPAIAALVAIGAVTAWRLRHAAGARVLAAAAVVATGITSAVLLGRATDYHPVLRWLVPVLALAVAAGILALPVLGAVGRSVRRPVLAVGAVALVLASLGGSAAYAATTAATPHEGSMPSAGPAVAAGGFGAGGGRGFPGGGTPPEGFAGGAPGAAGGAAPGGSGTGGITGGTPGSSGSGTGGFGGDGGASTNTALVKLLEASTTRWAAATIGANSAAPLELASDGAPVMAIGGFTGSDPSPTLAQFKAYVAAGDIHYFIAGGGFGGRGGSGSSSAITQWVEANYTATTVGGTTVYDLTGTAS